MIRLAVRYLLARRRQTVLMLLGIFFGTAAYVAISGFMLGFREYLINQLVNNNPHVHIDAREDFLADHSLDEPFYSSAFRHVFWDPAPSGRKDSAIVENPQNWYRLLRADPRVIAYSPLFTASVVFTNGKATVPATLIGCDPLQQVKVTTIGDYVTEGKFADLGPGGNRVLIGEELRRKLGVRTGQIVTAALGNGAPAPFKVIGVYSTGSRFSDASAYAAIADVQKVAGALNQVNEIAVRLRDHTEAAAIAATWSKLAAEKVESWDQLNANIFEVFRVQDAVRFLSIGAIMVVAAFGIYNVLNMTVMQKRRDVALLRSMGFSPGEIVSLFFSQGLMLGLTGTALGLAFGYGFCRWLETLPFSGGPFAHGMGHFMVSLNPAIYAQAATIALLSAVLASILPARAAGKLAPIEIIRAGAE